MSSGGKAKKISITTQIVYITAKRKVLGKMIHDECKVRGTLRNLEELETPWRTERGGNSRKLEDTSLKSQEFHRIPENLRQL